MTYQVVLLIVNVLLVAYYGWYLKHFDTFRAWAGFFMGTGVMSTLDCLLEISKLIKYTSLTGVM